MASRHSSLSLVQCFNCGHSHADCFLITIRRSGRSRTPPGSVSPPPGLRSLPIPTHSSARTTLRDYIWDEFEVLMDENKRDRQRILGRQQHHNHHNPHRRSTSDREDDVTSTIKGQLKTDAPLPWLSWTSPCGERGQTRNKANWEGIWERVVERQCRGRRGDGMWLSSVLLPGEEWVDGISMGEKEHEAFVWAVREAGDEKRRLLDWERDLEPLQFGVWDEGRAMLPPRYVSTR